MSIISRYLIILLTTISIYGCTLTNTNEPDIRLQSTPPQTSGQLVVKSGNSIGLFSYQIKSNFAEFKLLPLNDSSPLYCKKAPLVIPKSIQLVGQQDSETNLETDKFRKLDGRRYTLVSDLICPPKESHCAKYSGEGIKITTRATSLNFEISGFDIISSSRSDQPSDYYGASLCRILGGEPISGKQVQDMRELAGLADYGNWCGLSNTRQDRNFPTKDGIDAVCRDHDLCLLDQGYHKCSCDGSFLKKIASASSSSSEGEAYRLAAFAAFQSKPCECRQRICSPFGCTTIHTPGLGVKC